MIAIIDLGIGNLSNVKKAVNGIITDRVKDIEKADKIILPGVGAFSAVMEKLNPLRSVIIDSINRGKPFLGICLGLQLMFESSEEGKGKGLGIFKGESLKFKNVRVPHIGWNSIIKVKESKILKGVKNGEYFYFVHSYFVRPEDREIVAAETEHQGFHFVSVVEKNNVFGVQFHPEKSGEAGKRILENFKAL